MSDQRLSRVLPIAALLGAVQASWSIFLWRELLRLRSGGDPFCVGGGSGCRELWNSPMASAIHDATGLPVAAWGLVWGLVAAGLALWTWWRVANRQAHGTALAALQLTGLAGVGAVVVLAGSLLAAGAFCGSCAVTYALTLAFAAVVLLGSGAPVRQHWARGAALAVAATAAGWLVLLYPGLRTPPSSEATIATVERADDLSRWVDDLPPPVKQMLSDTLAAYADTRPGGSDAGVPVLGPSGAPVRITDFSDLLCSHCAQLHAALERLREVVPPGRLALQSRHFPLDASCNPLMERSTDPARCAGARALICIPDPEQAFDVAGAMFREPALSEARVVELASQARSRAELEACMASPETAARLASDIERAASHDIHGTPLVLVNDRRASAFPPFLFAITLASGDAGHPAFSTLPPARPIPPHTH